MNYEPKIILALDVDNHRQAVRWVKLLYPQVKIFKVGLQLYTACGPKIIADIRKAGAEVFLDLKFFDIPNSVANAVRQAVRLKVKMLTLHILGGKEMLEAAVRAAKDEGHRLKSKPSLLIGVTVLTSKEAKCSEVLTLARIGIESGLDGLVCSAKEAVLLRKEIKKKFFIVTAGIRPRSIVSDDQRRTATAREAVQAGSDFLVVGRPILEARDPIKTMEEIARSCYGRGD